MVNFVYTGNPKTGTLANSEDLFETPHDAVFHQGLHFLIRQKRSLEKEIKHFWNYNLCTLNTYNGAPKVYCFKPEGINHYYIKGKFAIPCKNDTYIQT